MSKVIGIDFGTTNTVVAFMKDNKQIQIIIDHDGKEIMPSVIAKKDGESTLVGESAKHNTQAFVKGDGVKEIKREIGKGKKILFNGRRMEASDIAAIILAKAKGNAEIYFKEEVKDAVITVPAEFSDAQRKEIIEAAVKAGFNVKKILNEPTAALLAYTQNKFANKKVLCYDFGGGTFDVSIANIDSTGVEVIAVGGDRELGGKDIDETIKKLVINDLRSSKGKILDEYGNHQVSLAVEKAKIELTKNTFAAIAIQNLSTTTGSIPYYKKITRGEFNNLIRFIINKTIKEVKNTLDSKNILQSEIDEVILVGGSSKMPIVRESLESLFGNKVVETNNMDMLVAIGAAIEAGNIMGINKSSRSRIMTDVCPFSLGLKVYRDGNDDVFDPIVYKNSPYGKEFSQKYNTAFDRQNSMVLEIYQGDSLCATENEHVTDFEITGIPESSAGEEWVRITFVYDENGIINIKAKILSTGLEKVHKYKYGYDLNKKVDTTAVDDNIISTGIRITASEVKEQLEREGLGSIAGKLGNYMKYEQQEKVEDMLNDILN